MSRLALKQFMAQVLADITEPMPCDVWTQLPKEDEVGTNAVIIALVPRSREKRKTISGLHSSIKEVEHMLELRVFWTNDESQQGGTQFDTLLQVVDRLVKAQSTPLMLTDPETGDQSQLIYLGEEIETVVPEPESVGDSASALMFSAVKSVQAVEYLQG